MRGETSAAHADAGKTLKLKLHTGRPGHHTAVLSVCATTAAERNASSLHVYERESTTGRSERPQCS